MMDIISQIIYIIALVSGAGIGEILSRKSFGVPLYKYQHIAETVIFIVLVVVSMNFIFLTQLNIIYITMINFILGMLCIIFARGISSLFGFFGRKVEEKREFKKEMNVRGKIASLYRSMRTHGISSERAEKILNEAFERKLVREVINFIENKRN